MVNVRTSIVLPYVLMLPSGEYQTPGTGGSICLEETLFPAVAEAVGPRTMASSVFRAADETEPELFTRTRRVQADRLLRRVNHLLRWYRVATGKATIIDLTRAQASPFRFMIDGSADAWGDMLPLEYESQLPPTPAEMSRAAFGDKVRRGLDSKIDPDVAPLNILDAEHALSVGRFREAVLLCWGAIDSTFVRKFRSMVDKRLGDEWAEGRDFLKGIDFGLRHKMTTGLRLLSGRSLYDEPDGFWQDLSTSYSHRNKIIHDGAIAHEDDAKLAIRLARDIVRIVASFDRPEPTDAQ